MWSCLIGLCMCRGSCLIGVCMCGGSCLIGFCICEGVMFEWFVYVWGLCLYYIKWGIILESGLYTTRLYTTGDYTQVGIIHKWGLYTSVRKHDECLMTVMLFVTWLDIKPVIWLSHSNMIN